MAEEAAWLLGADPSRREATDGLVGGKTSQWNIKVFRLLTENLKSGVIQKWMYLPQYEDFYYEFTVIRKFNHFATKWHAAQSRHVGPGRMDFEMDQQVADRLGETDEKERKAAHQNKHRHTVCGHPHLGT